MLIFLIGYMGSGKSVIGRKLAHKLHYEFIDLDEYIEKKYNQTISEIFAKQGEQKFRELENKYLKELITKSNAVIATGGGTPCFYDNMKLLNKHGITIYLKATPEFLFKRLKKSPQKRPLLEKNNKKELLGFIKNSLKEREKYYLKAKYVIDAENVKIEEITKLLIPA